MEKTGETKANLAARELGRDSGDDLGPNSPAAAGAQAARGAKMGGWLLLAALLGGNFALALGAPLARLADTGPVSAAFWRMFLALPFLIVFARMGQQKLSGMPRKTLVLVAIASIAFAADMASFNAGAHLTRMGNVTLFANIGSLILMVWGFVAARMLPGRYEWIAIACALVGSALLLGQSFEIAFGNAVGDMLGIFAGVSYAVYLLTLQSERSRFGSWSLLVWVSVFASPFLLALALALGEPVWPTNWWPIIALCIFGQLIGQGLIVYSLGHFPPLIIGLALLTQPAIAAGIGYVWFGEFLGVFDVIGMTLLGSALVVARASQPTPQSKP